ncbi:MAG: tripartite tricarboxylate transporter substrate binding protein [Xanthobacteraceae bacterium]|jgi:tripartite-type tricarboxylate transporter receptor subunit TctC
MRRLIVAAGLVLFSLVSAQADSWPQRNVTFILPLGAGSGVDVTSRLIADKLSAKWGKPVVIENRPGGDAMVAISAFLSATDGHTLFMAPTSTFTAHPLLHAKLPYEISDLVPIARATNTLIAIGVPASLGVNSLAEFVKLAKDKPGSLNYAGTTGAVDFVVSGFLKESGVDVAKVPYKDGVQALNDLAEGRIQIYSAAYAIMRPQVEAGKVKVLALMNKERAASLPNIPTAKESGFPSLTLDGLVGLFGQRQMSAELRDRISADLVEVTNDPEFSKRVTATGQVVRPGNAAEFAAEIDEQRNRIAQAAKAAGLAQ